MSEVKTKEVESKLVIVKFSKPCSVNERMYRAEEVAGFDKKITELIEEQKFGSIVKK